MPGERVELKRDRPEIGRAFPFWHRIVTGLFIEAGGLYVPARKSPDDRKGINAIPHPPACEDGKGIHRL